MIRYCANCGNGVRNEACPWCGGTLLTPPMEPPAAMCDTECYPNYWLCGIGDEEFELYDGHPLDMTGMRRALSRHRIVTFNGNNYDLPMIMLALSGADNTALKAANDMIIKRNVKPWIFYQSHNLQEPDWIDHVDLFEVAPGPKISLKGYGARMHSKRLQDLPFDPEVPVMAVQREQLKLYCRNDRETTSDLWDAMTAQVKLREQMSTEYGIDLRSKSDAQIAEAVMKRLLPFKVERPSIAAGHVFYYQPPEWLRFVNLNILDIIRQSPFTVTDTGNVEMDKALENTRINIGNSTYRMGIGGLHSSESGIAYEAKDGWVISDHDVASYYPSLILVTGIAPTQIGSPFREIYRGWYERRLAAKRGGDKKTANSLKTLLNGTFGKLLSKYSIFYAPSEGMKVTLTGQLALLMLIEMLETCGVRVISANTDGIVVHHPVEMTPLRDDVIRWWEGQTGFATEESDYSVLASRDVNNYVAISTDGKVKLKGAYAPSEPGPSGWPGPTGEICVDAIVAFLQHGTPLEHTVRSCLDVRKLIYVRQVKGGGAWAGQYLGKMVRWYYAKEGGSTINYISNGNKVPRTDGCKPLMELPDSIPYDVDYDWYISEARGMLADLGVNELEWVKSHREELKI